MERDEIIFAKDLQLSEFLNILKSKDYNRLFPNNCFPTEEMMNEYLDTISSRSDIEIRSILRKFIIHNCTFGADESNAQFLLVKNNIAEENIKTEYNRRLLTNYLLQEGEVWEGLTWIIDLLPHNPNEAINVISSYFLANCQMLPDNCLNALSDCITIIRARYIDYKHPADIFWNLNPSDFEYLIAALFEKMDYTVHVTQSSYDNGVDVFAEQQTLGKKEKIIIQCKRYTKETIGVTHARNLLGVVIDKKVTKGILVTSTQYSREAQKFSKNNPSIELIDCNGLMKLLNSNFGTYWTKKLDNIIFEQKLNNSRQFST